MPAHVIIHADFLDPFLLAIKNAVERRGGTVAQGTGFDDENLHITHNLDDAGPNVIVVPPTLVPPYRFLDHPSLKSQFDPDKYSYVQVKPFFEELRANYVIGKRGAAAVLPDAMVVICLSYDDHAPEHRATVAHMIEGALATGSPVVVANDDALMGGDLGQWTNQYPSVDVYHDDLADILHKCDVLVSRTGAGVLLAHIHRKPAILFSPAPFDHVSPVVSDEQTFEQAYEKAKATDGIFAKYLYWLLKVDAYRADMPNFGDRLLAAFAELGFDSTRLGLDIRTGATDRIIATHEAAQSMTAFINETPDLAGTELVTALKVHDKAWVFHAKQGDMDIVIKRFFEADPAHTVRSLEGELHKMAKELGQGPFQVNRCLMAWPQHGTAVLSHAPGQRIYDDIAAATGDQRAALFKKAGLWLDTYVAPRNRQSTFGSKYWVKQLDERSREGLSPDDLQLYQAGRDALGILAEGTMGCPVTQAAVHGDFSGINLMHHNGTLTGVDIQGESWQALARDASLFLVWQAMHDPQKGAKRTYGIHSADYDAFFSGLPMLADEHDTTVPFFVGWHLLDRVLERLEEGREPNREISLLRLYLADIIPLLEKHA